MTVSHPSPKYQLNERIAMQLGMIGLGRMGANMVRRLTRGGQQCIGYDSHPAATVTGRNQGGRAHRELTRWMISIRTLCAGPSCVVDGPGSGCRPNTIANLVTRLEKDDIIYRWRQFLLRR